ncbi:MAG: hypothetical protein OEZ01_16170 [Candidatus Heimdallarchaeota archaeon]|nr:hypothetical protein [Candidatus Heimdallarchaeota archaeon]MDH5647547.1 hypothetical protein [Candidatus Heimdallarchaeota archaeon]
MKEELAKRKIRPPEDLELNPHLSTKDALKQYQRELEKLDPNTEELTNLTQSYQLDTEKEVEVAEYQSPEKESDNLDNYSYFINSMGKIIFLPNQDLEEQ